MVLHIADNFNLPKEAVTETFGILAKRGMGKTYTAMVIAEEMIKSKMQIVAADPTGAWWGMRAAADGKAPGLPIIVMGGEHGDVPLEESSGKIVGDFVVDHQASVVLDLSLFRKGQMVRFMTDFAENLYHRNRSPLHLFLDEADLFAPQRPMHGQERLLGAIEDIVRRGRIKGLGITMVTQRAAVINKNVLTQCETLMLLRTVSPQDRAAAEEWIKVHDVDEKKHEVMSTLHTLPRGTAWVWSPGWLEVLKKIEVRKRETFDSSATPGQKRIEPKLLAPVDLESLKEKLAATIERAKADDPRELRRQITELKKELGRGKSQSVDRSPEKLKALEVEVSKLRSAVRNKEKTIREIVAELDKIIRNASQFAYKCEQAAKLAKIHAEQPEPITDDSQIPCDFGSMEEPVPSVDVPRKYQSINKNGRLPVGEMAILRAAAQYEGGVGRDQLSVLTGYKRSSRDAYVARLKGKELVEINQNLIVVTETGINVLGSDYEPLPTGKELQDYWMRKLPEGERRILEILIAQEGRDVLRESLDEPTGYRRSSRDAYISRLMSRRLVESPSPGVVKASANLFE